MLILTIRGWICAYGYMLLDLIAKALVAFR